MKTNKDIWFSYYSGNIYESESIGLLNLEEFIEVHKQPTTATIIILEAVKQADKAEMFKEKRALKHSLYAFTPSVVIHKGYKRSYENIIKFTGLMQLDFDHIDTIEGAIQIKQHLFNNHKEIVCSYLSPSGLGIKCLMRIKQPQDKDHYKALHKAMTNEFDSYGYLDHATKNAVLPLFLSADPKILYRDFSDCDEWTNEDWSKPDYVNLNDDDKNNFNSNDICGDRNTERVIRITSDKINNIVSEGHPQVRTTSLILGSRVAAGYIDKISAENLIFDLIKNNSYLQKGISGYLSTAKWAINQGINSPKYF